VVSVVPGSPAAGLLRAGDILVGVSGSSARSHGLGPAIFDQLARYKPGQAARLDIYRNGRPLVVGIKLGSLADQKAMNAGVSLPAPNGTVAEYML
jgi:S1-C subfamily serine protease